MKLSLNSEIVNSVPLNEYYQENVSHKGLVFIQHGYQSNKNYGADYLALTLARMGFFAVSIDAYKHGERMEEPFISKDEVAMLIETPGIIRRTAVDIIKLHKFRYIDRFPTFDLIGVSMGAMIAYYASTKTDKINKLVPVIGTPDFIYQAHHNLDNAKLNKDNFLTEYVLKYLHRMSPMNKVHKIKYNQLLILNGTQDHVVPIEPTNRFIKEQNLQDYQYKTYEVGHEVPREMQQDIFKFIGENYE